MLEHEQCIPAGNAAIAGASATPDAATGSDANSVVGAKPVSGTMTNTANSHPSSGAMGKCPAGAAANAETCDNADNDCDGRVDEDIIQNCGSSKLGVCRLGKQTCNDGRLGECVGAVEPAQEVCDPAGADENCDGVSNEGCTCTPGMTKACGTTGGICQMGEQTCMENGMWGSECVGEVKPKSEVCDGQQDDDCDGVADDSDSDCACVSGMQESCVAGKGICAEGKRSCTDGKWSACQGPSPQKEVCDGKPNDEDCDGDPDNGCACTNGEPRACPSGTDTGECEAGTQMCVNGQWSNCMGAVGPAVEKCDGKDSDCDDQDDTLETSICPGGRPCLKSGSTWACAKCTEATVATDCGAAASCKTPVCNAGQCGSDSAPELTVCPRSGTWEGYCRSGSCAIATSANGKSEMKAGEALYPGESLRGSGSYELMYQEDGNLVLWINHSMNQFAWAQADMAREAGALIMQPDGNLVMWVGEDRWLYLSGTGSMPQSGNVLKVTTEAFIQTKSGTRLKTLP